MMYKKKQGFSLAELLISLLIISIVLAAAIPTITKRNSAGSEKIWHWSDSNNNVYSAIGSNQTVLIGSSIMPFKDKMGKGLEYSKLFFDEDDIDINSLASAGVGTLSASERPLITTDGDKLSILKRSLYNSDTSHTDNFLNSHISFYNLENTSTATTGDITYAGRISSDRHNLAFGIGTLQQLRSSSTSATSHNSKYNTAIGHYALFSNTIGSRNTAIGEKTLTYNIDGNNNTAVGYQALARSHDVGNDNNTAVGAGSISNNQNGFSNTAFGSSALKWQNYGSYNTAIGDGACAHIRGNNNICIGYGAGANNVLDTKYPNGIPDGNLGELYQKDDYIVIGNDAHGAPIIEGTLSAHDRATGNQIKEKELNVNTRYFNVKPFDGSRPIFQVLASSGPYGPDFPSYKGYEKKGSSHNAKFGEFFFTFRDTQQLNVAGVQSASVQLNLNGSTNLYNPTIEPGYYAKQVKFDVIDPNRDEGVTSDKYGQIIFNESLRFIPPKSTGGYTKIIAHNPYTSDEKLTFLELSNGAMLMQDPSISKFLLKMTENHGFLIHSNEAQPMKLSLKNKNFHANADNYTFEKMNSSSGCPIFIIKGIGTKVNASKFGGTDDLGVLLQKIWADIETQINSHVTNYHSMLPSDIRLKNVSGDSVAGLKEINALEVKNYTYKNDKEKTPHVGVIAQQLQKVFPNSVTKDEDGYLRIRTEEIFYAMVNSIKELFSQIQDLTAKVVGLDKRLTELENQNAILKKQNEDFENRLKKLEAKLAD
ncbi:MAG: prepilin-type N-terminal cleavage/methylation domain-containing protein [Cyanobacteria bacterium SIG29]|nr:prepilin-type N-terminal cleavage/methylation domain-containing protein [Cyanobacteria bacterium SIG29]